MVSPIHLYFNNSSGVDPSRPEAPTNGVWGDLFQPLFGTETDEFQQQLWVAFLQQYNLPNPPPTNAATQALFTEYKNAILNLGAPTSGFWGNLFQPLFGSLTADQQQQIWMEFLRTTNLTDPPPEDLFTENLFTRFAADAYVLLAHMILTEDIVSINIPLFNTPTTGFYGDAMKSYFADLTAVQKQRIWVQFLVNNNFLSSAPPTDSATEKLFITYARAVLGIMQNRDIQSPEEIKKRVIMSATIETLLKMLNALQNTIAVESQNLVFYGTWQQEFTKMMARVPTYIGSADSTVHFPSTITTDSNFNTMTLGYNNINMEDIAEWWAHSSLNGLTEPFTISSVAYVNLGTESAPQIARRFTIDFVPQSGTTPGMIRGVFIKDNPGFGFIIEDFSENIPLRPGVLTYTGNPAQSQMQIAQEDYNTKFKETFVKLWNVGGIGQVLADLNTKALEIINFNQADFPATNWWLKSTTDTSSNAALQIFWQDTYVVPAASHHDSDGNITTAGRLSDQMAKLRAEFNAKLQGFIENVRSKRRLVQNKAEALQSNLDLSRQTISNQSDLLNSILQSITSLIKQIARR